MFPGSTVDAILRAAVDEYGDAFADVLSISRVWVNGESAEPGSPVSDDDEVAVLPPVSGGG